MPYSTAAGNQAANFYYHAVAEAIQDRVCIELNTMAKVLNTAVMQPPLSLILFRLDTLLPDATRLLNAGEIDAATYI